MEDFTVTSGKIGIVNTFTVIGEGGEAHVWHNKMSTPVDRDWMLTCEISFDRYNRDSVGRHGGVHIFGNKISKGCRGGGGNGEILDWIDRSSDRGFRTYGNISGTTPRNHGNKVTDNPDSVWTIVYVAITSKICFLVDGSVIYNYRLPQRPKETGLGFWCWGGNSMTVRNLKLFA